MNVKANGEIIFIWISALINIIFSPIAFLIGLFSTDAGGGILAFLGGFMLIQGIPLVILIVSILLFIRKKREIRRYNQHEEIERKELFYKRVAETEKE